jgi:eukaryotic-like serine/threonine-protein kinase
VIGETLNGQYRIVRQLGGGGMGAVFEAEDTTSGEHVAVKVISTGDLAKDKALIGRFQREAKAASSVDTDHIVRVLQTGTDPTSGQPFMVMEYLLGEDVSHLFRRLGPLPPELALRIGAQACAGLQKAHEQNVIHRDIKPANLFLAQKARTDLLVVKILDFGIAKIRMDKANGTDTTGLTRTGSMVGSPLYMSPEQARGSKTIDHRADLWSLGIVLYQALTGRTPNQDIDALGELIIAICSELPRPVQEVAPWVDPAVAAIVHGVLRFDPGERFQTAAEMLAAIRPLLKDGWDIHEPMLHEASPELRTQVAPRLSIRPLATTPGRILGGLTDPSVTGSSAASAISRDGVTSSGLAHSPLSQPQGSSSRTSLVVAGAAILGIGIGVGVYKVASNPGDRVLAATTATASAMTAPVAATAPPTATASVAPAPRTVRVAIGPPDASIEVDGVAAKLADGSVEVSGSLGSVHHVRVTRGSFDTERDVVVTQDGAMPAKIDLEVGPKGPRPGGALPRPGGAPTATGAPGAGTTPPPAPTFKEKFE